MKEQAKNSRNLNHAELLNKSTEFLSGVNAKKAMKQPGSLEIHIRSRKVLPDLSLAASHLEFSNRSAIGATQEHKRQHAIPEPTSLGNPLSLTPHLLSGHNRHSRELTKESITPNQSLKHIPYGLHMDHCQSAERLDKFKDPSPASRDKLLQAQNKLH